MYGNGFLNRGFTDREEILYGGSATSHTGFLPFWGIAPGMADHGRQQGAMWSDMLVAEALAFICTNKLLPNLAVKLHM